MIVPDRTLLSVAADEKDKVYEYEGSDAEDEESGGPPPPPPPQGAPKSDPFAPPFANAAAAAAVAQHRATYIHQQQQQQQQLAAAQQRGGRPVQPPRQTPTFLPAQQPGARAPPQQLVQRVGMYRPPPAVQQAQQHRPSSQVFNGAGLDAAAGPRGSVIEVTGEPSTAVAAEEHTLRQKFARFQFSKPSLPCRFVISIKMTGRLDKWNGDSVYLGFAHFSFHICFLRCGCDFNAPWSKCGDVLLFLESSGAVHQVTSPPQASASQQHYYPQQQHSAYQPSQQSSTPNSATSSQFSRGPKLGVTAKQHQSTSANSGDSIGDEPAHHFPMQQQHRAAKQFFLGGNGNGANSNGASVEAGGGPAALRHQNIITPKFPPARSGVAESRVSWFVHVWSLFLKKLIIMELLTCQSLATTTLFWSPSRYRHNEIKCHPPIGLL
ncbi:unnamed protein product [Rodentolepis nana]|uniref:CBM21 domain-containing protein n=1 Tax=Rodentolepis nana TaxID=102285 RepID=A0A0R3TL33_RODNA|nr:unnamed protein product [Rodentolepis nana]